MRYKSGKPYKVESTTRHITKDEYKMMKQCSKIAISITDKTVNMCKKHSTVPYTYLLARVIIKLNRELKKEVNDEQRG